ncbi:DUF2207 domain-containing protein [Candidatus Saccharibacteria bacterium]|nr:DUF2207 domain-containing protein [Candidatus Saccharibacteria bacterium]MBR0372751.1 DUF2207 domain-containing protein [Candidatus Saccharibacteria bacterium]
MKKVFLICQIALALVFSMPAFANDLNNFYFSDFTGDYYLSKDENGVSHLKVVESVTAVFPDYNQNKGICRQIPFTNQNGKNITLPSLSSSNLTLTRNGSPEPIYSITKENGYYNVCTGTEEYILGAQTYVFTYEFSKVVTEFTDDGKEYQELYWDTNGNGAVQRFESVTARIHFSDPEVFSGEKWCYVGKYKESGQERCEISEIEDGIQFKAKDLTKYENLTFDVELKAGSFYIAEPDKNYAYVWIITGLGVVCLLSIIYALKKFLRSREKANYYKGIFVKPEYQPSKEYSLAEMSEIYIGKKKDVKVAMLLDLIVNKKITLKKGEKKKWSIIINENLFDGEYSYLVSILNGGTKPEVGSEVEIKRRTATSKLVSLKNQMERKILGDLKEDGLVEAKYKMGMNGINIGGLANTIMTTIIMTPVVVMIGLFVLAILSDALGLEGNYGGELVFAEYFFQTALIMIVATIMIVVFLTNRAAKYEKHTHKGLEASRYMDGLKLYIKMAEADRMKMLQSVMGVDTSAEGIVRLYEKLLPYAAVFGLEESWMNEMKKYCELEEIEEPDYLISGFTTSEILRGLNHAASYATNSTVMSSSGGGSSSGFSGGGGGGFSGGGGGGGGFSGR